MTNPYHVAEIWPEIFKPAFRNITELGYRAVIRWRFGIKTKFLNRRNVTVAVLRIYVNFPSGKRLLGLQWSSENYQDMILSRMCNIINR